MRTGGDKEIVKALKPFEKTQVPLAVSKATMDGRSAIASDRGSVTWIDSAYPKMLRELSEVMVQLGYKRGKEAKLVADAYMNGYVRGLGKGAKAAITFLVRTPKRKVKKVRYSK